MSEEKKETENKRIHSFIRKDVVFCQKSVVLNMKKITLLLLLFLLFISCTQSEGVIEDITQSLSKTPPSLLSWSLVDNQSFSISFSETVEIKEMTIKGMTILKEELGSSFSLSLPFTLNPGEKEGVMISIVDMNGNKERIYLTIRGKNYNIPLLLINEVSTKGTQSNPDRIELYVLTEGDIAGVTISDDKFSFSFPSLKVNEGDIILIHWDRKTTKNSYERNRGKMTYIFNANSPSTLSGPEGAIVLRKEEKGEIIDAFFYSEKGEEALKEGEKNKLYLEAISKENWEGEAFDSTQTTSSRVIARLPGGVDTDSSDDFFITAARRSTFGEENEYVPYQGP